MTTTYDSRPQILKYNKGVIACPATIDSASVAAASNGAKIVKAGSLIGSITTGKTILSDHASGKIVTDATVEGILLYDVDVTSGDAVGTLLTHGIVYGSKLPVAATAAQQAALKFIGFEE